LVLKLARNYFRQATTFARLEAICNELECQPADILIYEPDSEG
jgi:DNA-binding Xre family transcriptional regulator